MEKVWHIKDPEEASPSSGESICRSQIRPKQKNPAVAFSLSIVFCGGGQIYNRDWKLGILLLLFTANFWAFLVIIIFSWRVLASDFRPYLSPANLLFVGWVSVVFALLVWFSSALQAYRSADKRRITPFLGVEKRLLPPLCSVFIPGWGQFLNGQVKKGALSLIASVLLFSSILSVFVLFLLWPNLEPSPAREVLEWNFSLSLLIMPLLALMWLVGVFDAWRVSSDDVKKESWLNRILYARNRVRLRGWRNTVFRRAGMTAFLFLILAFAIFAGSRFIPKSYYLSLSRQIGVELSNRGMVVVPGMINRFLAGN